MYKVGDKFHKTDNYYTMFRILKAQQLEFDYFGINPYPLYGRIITDVELLKDYKDIKVYKLSLLFDTTNSTNLSSVNNSSEDIELIVFVGLL